MLIEALGGAFGIAALSPGGDRAQGDILLDLRRDRRPQVGWFGLLLQCLALRLVVLIDEAG